MALKKMILWNADWLTKFTKGECVLTDWELVTSTDVKVYKIWADGEPLRNDAWNKVSYALAKNRLRDFDKPETAYEKAGILEKRVLDKLFTDKNYDIAATHIAKINEFVKVTYELRQKLDDIANKLLAKVAWLNDAADKMDADAFKNLSIQAADIVEYLKGKPMTYINELHEHLNCGKKQEDYDPATDLLGEDD